jgi:hypothetical protein
VLGFILLNIVKYSEILQTISIVGGSMGERREKGIWEGQCQVLDSKLIRFIASAINRFVMWIVVMK